jgi:hypothetical protein
MRDILNKLDELVAAEGWGNQLQSAFHLNLRHLEGSYFIDSEEHSPGQYSHTLYQKVVDTNNKMEPAFKEVGEIKVSSYAKWPDIVAAAKSMTSHNESVEAPTKGDGFYLDFGNILQVETEIEDIREDAIILKGDQKLLSLLESLDNISKKYISEAEYQGRKVQLGKPTRGDVKKFKVYVKDPSTGNVKKVNFGDPNMKIKKSNPKRRKSFRARHNCDNPGPRTKARYWSCRKW